MGNRLEQPSGWYLPAGTTITGVNGTLLIIPMLNAKVDTENSNIILMGEQMTWLDFSNRIEEWGR